MKNSKIRMHIVTVLVFVSIGSNSEASELITDGNFDNLRIGSAPDNGDPNGAWQVASKVGESGDSTITIVATNSFEPGATGNSLSLGRPEVLHQRSGVENQFNEIIEEEENEIVRATFELFIPTTLTPGRPNASFFIGGDHGDQSFPSSPHEDRGPQLEWNSRGMLRIAECDPTNDCGGWTYKTVVEETPLDSWQQIQLDIDLTNDTYDMFWGANRGELELVATHAAFRSGEQDFLDRFTVAFFGNRSFPEGNAYLDNLNIEILTKNWLGDANLDGEFNSTDLVDVFTYNLYETDETAAWSQGDWNGDRLFNSGDLVAAFQDGGYERGKRRRLAIVPEPHFGILVSCGFLALIGHRKRSVRAASLPAVYCRCDGSKTLAFRRNL